MEPVEEIVESLKEGAQLCLNNLDSKDAQQSGVEAEEEGTKYLTFATLIEIQLQKALAFTLDQQCQILDSLSDILLPVSDSKVFNNFFRILYASNFK